MFSPNFISSRLKCLFIHLHSKQRLLWKSSHFFWKRQWWYFAYLSCRLGHGDYWPVSWHGKPGCLWSSLLFHMRLVLFQPWRCHLLFAPFLQFWAQFPTSPTGCPRTQRVLNLNDEISLHAHIYHEKMSKIVPYWGSDDSVYPLELLIEHWGYPMATWRGNYLDACDFVACNLGIFAAMAWQDFLCLMKNWASIVTFILLWMYLVWRKIF